MRPICLRMESCYNMSLFDCNHIKLHRLFRIRFQMFAFLTTRYNNIQFNFELYTITGRRRRLTCLS